MYDQPKTDELSRFAGIEPGSTVLDVYPGKGDWTRLFSDIVGPKGRVYSFVPAEVAHFESDPVGQMTALTKQPGRGNVRVASADLLTLPNGPQSFDVVWMHLFYHDLHTTLMQSRGATPARFNQAAYDRLKPGGRYVVVDHAAAAGTGADKAQSLHRIDPAAVRAEVEAAGFILDAETALLANDDDPHAAKVFDPSVKGRTDRFAYRFVRP
jgi:predicted methyltransferase